LRKGTLIAAIIMFVIGIAMVTVGGINFSAAIWHDWVLWFGVVIFDIGLIVLVISFIKKPSEETVKTPEATA